MSDSLNPDSANAGDQPETLARLLSLTHGRWRPTALIVEDHPDVADGLRRVLLQMQVQSLVSPDGELAVKMAKVIHFDFVILDILLPGQDGFEVFHALRNLPTTIAAPVMFVTCVTDEASQAKGRDLGAAHYLCKPFELAEFQSHFGRILRAEAQRRANTEAGRFRDN
jgi:DNA-binding response OmpR family regulator